MITASHLLVRLVRAIDRTPAAPRLNAWLRAAYEASENLNHFEIPCNGEKWLIDTVARELRPARVIDIGANRGEWLGYSRSAMPEAHIVACEPQPELAARLAREHSSDDRVVVKPWAIGRSDDSMELYCFPGHDSLASSVNWHPAYRPTVAKVPMHTGGTLLAELGWDGADFMKIDVEGMEFDALSSFGQCLAAGRIGVVQFEFGGFSLQQKVLMKDFHDLLGERYALGRLMPARVDFRDYDFRWETAALSNFVACRKDLAGRLEAA